MALFLLFEQKMVLLPPSIITRPQNNITELFGEDVPVVLRAIQFGFEHPEFTRKQIQEATGLDDATWQRYWERMKMVIDLRDDHFCLTTEGVGIYLQLLSFQHAERQARRANCLATIAIIVALVSITATTLMALG